MEIKNQFTQDEIIRFFRENGLQVREAKIMKYSGNESWLATEWQVQNPHDGIFENIETAFRRVIERRRSELFLENYNKVDLLNQLKK